MELSFPAYAVLIAAAFIGGMINSMAGGGGLVTLPALLIVGIPPHVALATNKVQSAFGATVGMIRYIRGGFVVPAVAVTGFASAFAGSWAGASAVLQVSANSLEALLPLLIILVGLTTLLRKEFGLVDRFAGMSLRLHFVTVVMAFSLGFYDGFFGPGTGSFLAFGFVLIYRFGFVRATANAKLINLASNYAAIIAFVLGGQVFWITAGVMAVANITGSWIGAGLAIRRGAKLIKPVFLLVMTVLLVKMLLF